MIAPGRDRHDACGVQRGEKRLNLLDAVRQVERVLGDVADVGHLAEVEGRDGTGGVHPRIKRDISRIWAGPWRAPARLVEPRSKGTPTSAMSSPA